MKRKLFSLVFAFAMTVSLFTAGASAVEPTYGDTVGHWAESSVDRWSNYGVVEGSNGQFDPNGELTCAQLATILTRLLGLPAAQSAGFTDNDPTAWYADAINRCAAAGILNGNGDGTVSPTATISRERAMVMLGRALGIEPIENPDLSQYGDAANVAPYAQGMMAALVDAGIVGGVGDNQLAPQGEINRASTVTILDRAITTYANTDNATVDVSEGKGITLIVANNVTVTGKVDTLIVASSENSVKLDGATVEKVSVTGEGSTVVLNNAEVKTVVASGEKAAVETTGTTKVETLNVTGTNAAVKTEGNTTISNLDVSGTNAAVETKGDTKVESIAVTGANTEVKTTDNTTVGKLEVSAENATVTTEGKTKVESLTVSGTNAAVETKGSTKIESVTVSEEATGTTVTTGSGTTISKVENSAEGTTVTGTGTVTSVESSKNVAVETKGTKVDNTGDSQITVTDSKGEEKDVTTGGSSTTSGTTVPVHSHSYTTSKWVFDDTYHWHAANCGHDLTIDKAEHTFSTEDHICTVCGQLKSSEAAAQINGKNYATLAKAIDAAVNGDTITLVNDVQETATVAVAGKAVTLDLNGKTITVTVNEENDAAVEVDGAAAQLTIKDSGTGGKLTAGEKNYGIYARDGGTIIVNSGTIESGYAALTGNNTTGNMNFTVNGGTLTAKKGPAIYMPGQVSLKVTGGTLNGGISLRMGQVNISGGTINAITSSIDSPKEYYNYSGNAWLPDALYVFGGTYTSEDGTYGNSLNLNITGGTFNCNNNEGSAVAIYDLGVVAQTMKVSISGNAVLKTSATSRGAYQVLKLTDIEGYNTKKSAGFNKEALVGKVTTSITGGTFSSAPTSYLAEGYIALVNADGAFTVSNATEISVTTATAQDYLDGKYGSINGKTLVLTGGDYGTLYLRQSLNASTRRTDLDENVWSYPAYYREFENVTIKGGTSVTCDGIKVEAGLFWHSSAPASNQAAMGRENSGFISYLSLKNITIDGITFDSNDQNAILLRDNTGDPVKGSALLVDGFTVKNCSGTGATGNTNVHFFAAGSGSNDQAFCGGEGNAKGYNNITITGCTMTSYYQPICWNNAVAVLKGFSVTNNTFTGCLDNHIQLSNKENRGTFTFTGNTLANMKGRFIRMTTAQSDTSVTFSGNTVTNPTGYDTGGDGTIAKVTGVSFTVTSTGNDWSTETMNADKTTWEAMGDTRKLSSTT